MIGVAGGVEKADVIVAALRGRYVNALVTDEVTARAIINLLNWVIGYFTCQFEIGQCS